MRLGFITEGRRSSESDENRLAQSIVFQKSLSAYELVHRRALVLAELPYATPVQELNDAPLIDDVQNAEQVPRVIRRLQDRAKDAQKIEARTRRYAGGFAPHAERASRDADALTPRVQRTEISWRLRRPDDRVGK